MTGNGGGDFNNNGGLIQALDGSEVQLTGGATINGGTLTTSGSGVIRNLGTATLNDVTNSGAFIANNASVTTLGGTINSTGSILINSTGSFTDLFINGDVTFTGSTLTLQNAARVRGTGTLFNGGTGGEAFTIQGETSNSGSLGTNELGDRQSQRRFDQRQCRGPFPARRPQRHLRPNEHRYHAGERRRVAAPDGKWRRRLQQQRGIDPGA